MKSRLDIIERVGYDFLSVIFKLRMKRSMKQWKH